MKKQSNLIINHLCIQQQSIGSLVFEPFDIDLPLIKMKYSHNISLKLIKSVNCSKLQALLSIQVAANQLNLLQIQKQNNNIKKEQKIEKEVQSQQVQQLQSRSKSPQKDDNKQKKKGELIQKLYKQQKTHPKGEQPQQQQNYFKDVLMNAIFLQNDKLFVIYRNPISPYLTEINNDNIIFSIDKNNTKEQIIRFLKFYDGFMRTKDETLYLNFIIENSVQQNMKEFIESKKSQGKDINFVHKAMKITPEGNIHGFWACIGTSLIFCPIINSIDSKIIEYKLSDVKGFLKYRYLMKHQGLEIWFYNKKRSMLLVFDDNQTQQQIYQYLEHECTKVQVYGQDIEQVTKLWMNHAITNFEYLMYLNTIANRSFNDVSAYPVFPWIVSNYRADQLDLENPDFFRDLSKPVGALNKHRLQKLKDFYTDILLEKYKNADGYLYPTHYSSPGLVVYFLIRKIPEFVIKLQNGVFGPTDRIFRGIESTWDNTLKLDADFKELIPEFYCSDGDFLVNNEKLELGISPEGELIDDAVLPNWANNVQDFIQKMKLCIESDYVSQNVHHWIDLIFGYKQRGENAKKANNVFYPLTYEQNINWSKYQSPYERAAMEIQVTEFGQCPLQLFKKQHPLRKPKHIYKGPNNLQDQLAHILQKYEALKIEVINAIFLNQKVQLFFQFKSNQILNLILRRKSNINQIHSNYYNNLKITSLKIFNRMRIINNNQLWRMNNFHRIFKQKKYNSYRISMQFKCQIFKIKQSIYKHRMRIQSNSQEVSKIKTDEQKEKIDQENSISSNFLQTVEDHNGQPINENDFDFLNETGNSTI